MQLRPYGPTPSSNLNDWRLEARELGFSAVDELRNVDKALSGCVNQDGVDLGDVFGDSSSTTACSVLSCTD
jgi:hypothetical protein